MIQYTYKFINWDEFSVWLKLMGFVRNEVAHGKKGGCTRWYEKANVQIYVPYYSHQLNEVEINGSVVATFQNPNELPQELLRSWAK